MVTPPFKLSQNKQQDQQTFQYLQQQHQSHQSSLKNSNGKSNGNDRRNSIILSNNTGR